LKLATGKGGGAGGDKPSTSPLLEASAAFEPGAEVSPRSTPGLSLPSTQAVTAPAPELDLECD
jgi:hypothetical protein